MLTRIICASVTVLLMSALWAEQPAPVQNAINSLAASLQVAPDQITIISAEAVQWPDSSLGLPQPGMMYSQIVTPGFRVILEADGKRYEYHTNSGNRAILATGTGAAPVRPAVPAAIADQCRKDLAARRNLPVDQISVANSQPQVFSDASLGLARPDEVTAQVRTPGYSLILDTGKGQFLYTATASAVRYGGPVDSWRYSALYLQPLADDANLNSSLMQASLAGTNPVDLLDGVSSFWPQNDGSILASRRTSRSSFELLYLAPGQHQNARVIQGGFDFGEAAVNADGTRWAAFKRVMVGQTSGFAYNALADDPQKAITIALPTDGKPTRLWWHEDNPVVLLTQADGHGAYYELDLAAATPTWRRATDFFVPENEQFLLNKSETLVVKTEEVEGKPVTRVIKQWFTGTENPVVAIENFKPQAMTVTPGHRFLLLTGPRDGATLTLAVDLRSGEVLQTLSDASGPVKLFLAPPQTWFYVAVVAKLTGGQ